MNIDTHLEILKETFLTIELCIERGIENHQRTIGFHTSLGSVEMLEAFLHKKNLLSSGARMNHTWMKSKKRINEKIPFDFPRKEEIVDLLYYIEKNRDELCYGKKVASSKTEEQIEHFNRLREIFREVGLNEI